MARSLAPLLVWGETSLFGSHGYEGTKITDVRVHEGVNPKAIQTLREAFEKFCEPCSPTLAALKLSELRVLTAHKAKDAKEVELLGAAYVSRLSAYPSDVIIAACDAWANANPFWPTWAELKNECDKRMSRRKQLRDALRG